VRRLQKLESTAEWPTSAIEVETNMGDLVDRPICREEMQPRRLHEESQPLEQLDEEIEEIIRLMIQSVETASNGKLSRGKPAIVAGQQQYKSVEEEMESSRELFGIQVDFNSEGSHE
jgi:hypothetical protein